MQKVYHASNGKFHCEHNHRTFEAANKCAKSKGKEWNKIIRYSIVEEQDIYDLDSNDPYK